MNSVIIYTLKTRSNYLVSKSEHKGYVENKGKSQGNKQGKIN